MLIFLARPERGELPPRHPVMTNPHDHLIFDSPLSSQFVKYGGMIDAPATPIYVVQQVITGKSGKVRESMACSNTTNMITAVRGESKRALGPTIVGDGCDDYGVDAGARTPNLECCAVDRPINFRSLLRQIKTPRKAGRQITTTTLWTRSRYQLKSLLGGRDERNTCCVSIKLTNR
ncbi:hypothetical protein [Streptosporangium lutulentum]|uniref:Uncharacterized protein n=1 Tax=Streptosporangium lutulentum TaxID=1461250 RepID=A0ABT9QU58_9ACTN|nr:hypothetical protein [Streptosporangium lutulentum]MDP9850307.1 hypothetical protein [Streptosporangium lutulentum]